MAMAGIRIKRDIGDEAEIWHFAFYRAACAADEIFGIERFAGLLVPQARVGKGKQCKRRNAELRRLGRGAHRQVDGEALDAGHGGNWFSRVFPFADKNRPDEIVDAQSVFADKPAGPVRFAVTPQTRDKIEFFRSRGGGYGCGLLRRVFAFWALR